MDGTILVVDDEAKIRATLRGVLSDEGFRVLDTDEGSKVPELVATQRPGGDPRYLDAAGGRHRVTGAAEGART